MEILDSLILGALQGITEFLPVSSSGHLVLVEHFLGLEVGALKSFDVVVHMGTLLAIVIYFWRDLLGILIGLKNLVLGKAKKEDPYLKLLLFMIIGTVPAVIVGMTLEDKIDMTFRSVSSVGMAMLVVAILFVAAENFYKHGKKHDTVDKWWQALTIGLAQSVALIPGISRSGITIATGLFSGIKRDAAARFSFLLGIPAMLGAGIWTLMKGTESSILSFDSFLLVGFASSFIFGLLSISLLMKFLKKHSLAVFAFYLAILGASVLLF